MKNKKNILAMLIFCVSLVICFYDSYGQSHVLLEVKNVHKKNLSYPCLSINECIDSIYTDADTLFIFLQDTRKFYKDERCTMILSRGYYIKKRTHEILIPIDSNFNFVILKSFDFICIFKKRKNHSNKFRIFSIKEDTNYDDKNFMDIKDSSDISIRE